MREWNYPKPKGGGLFPKHFRIVMVEVDDLEYRVDILIGRRRFTGEPYRGLNAEIFTRRAAADLWKKMDVRATSS